MFRRTLSVLVVGLLFALGGTPPASAGQTGIKLGVLKCEQVRGSGVNLLIHSTVQVRCVFASATGGRAVHYKGETGIGLGIDLNWNKTDTIAFTVFGASTDAGGPHPLSGKYIGGRASASVGIGAGAQALIGGSSDQFTLQPLALEASRGVGVAAGLGYLYLEPAN